MKEIVEREFTQWITTTFQTQPEIVKYLLQHERKQTMLENLCSEVRKAEIKMATKFTKNDLKLFVKSVGGLYARNALQALEDALLSQAEKVRRIDEAGRIKDIEDEQNEVNEKFASEQVISYPGKATQPVEA